MSQITGVLEQLFTRHRIVLWYDHKRELRGEFEALLLPGVELIEIHNNEFQVKHRILREQPEQKFLLYHEGPPPDDVNNWLLDVRLAHGEFRADQAVLWLNELGLPPALLGVIEEHSEFFTSIFRRTELRKLLSDDEDVNSLQMKMLAVCADAEAALDPILESLLDEIIDTKQPRNQLLQQFGLDKILFEQLKQRFKYASSQPGIEDFAIALFKSAYYQSLGVSDEVKMAPEALIFLRRWRDSLAHHKSFEKISEKAAGILNIEQDLSSRDSRKVYDIDFFELIEEKIIHDLITQIADRTITCEDATGIIRKRRQSHWFDNYRDIYDAAGFAAEFLEDLKKFDLAVHSIDDGISRYIQTWYQLDQLYRKFLFHARKVNHLAILDRLAQIVEKHYSTNYLLLLNNHWQQVVDSCEHWNSKTLPMQSQFYSRWVKPVVDKNLKLYVIISDALRYEIGEELAREIRKEDRYDAELEGMLGMLPSYTQLGMAALLPNRTISICDDTSGTALVDGQPAGGTQNRDKILKQELNGKATAIRAEDVLTMPRDSARELIRDNDVVYIYHNRIDSTGDKIESEERVFEAVEETIADLITLIKKLTAANATNLIITSDHGFIYQNHPLDESEFAEPEIDGNTILYTHRRFILGKGLRPNPSLKHFTATQVGLVGDLELQLPKSTVRLRKKGSGSRFIHGGSSLQEVILPVVVINKKRESDIKKVDADILRGSKSIITTGQFSVSIYQSEPVDEKTKMRTIFAGIYSLSGELISDQHTLILNLEAENPREREIPIRFILTQEAEKYNNQEVLLRLSEQVPSTSFTQEYKSARFTLRRSFTSDF